MLSCHAVDLKGSGLLQRVCIGRWGSAAFLHEWTILGHVLIRDQVGFYW
jgi:hypothetical protein